MRKLVLAVAVSAFLNAFAPVMAVSVGGGLGAVSIIGCKRAAPGAKLEGQWRGLRAEGVPATAAAAANAFAARTEILARGNVITISIPSSKDQQSTFTIDEETKTSLVLHTDRDGPLARESFSFSDDGRTMTWRLDGGRSITFVKVKD